MKDKFYSFLFKETDSSILSLFRIIFGGFMVYQILKYYQLDYTYQFMSGPEYLFSYYYLDFLKPLPDYLLKAIHHGLFISAVFIVLGLFYRYAMTFFFFGITYFSFIDKTLYNNHLYLISLISFVMIFMEADKKYSLRKLKKGTRLTVPNWNVRLLQFLIFVVYFYGGLAKLNIDWLSGGIPEIMYNASKDSYLHSILPKKFLVNLINYGGILYDLLIGFILLYKPTRMIGFLMVLTFNLTNGIYLFRDIGLFPYFMICATALFFDPENVGKFIQNLFNQKDRGKKKKVVKKTVATPKLQLFTSPTKRQQITAACLSIFVLFQLLFPFRYFLLTDNPEWYGKASKFSWRMKMQSRSLKNMKMTLTDRSTGAVSDIDHTSFLSSNQFKHLVDDPYYIVQFGKYLNRKAIERGMSDPIVKANILLTFNGRPAQLMVNPDTDLSRVDESPFVDNDWIVPLQPRE